MMELWPKVYCSRVAAAVHATSGSCKAAEYTLAQEARPDFVMSATHSLKDACVWYQKKQLFNLLKLHSKEKTWDHIVERGILTLWCARVCSYFCRAAPCVVVFAYKVLWFPVGGLNWKKSTLTKRALFGEGGQNKCIWYKWMDTKLKYNGFLIWKQSSNTINSIVLFTRTE